MSQISGFDYKTTYKGLLALLKAESRKIITFLFLFSSRSLSPQHPPSFVFYLIFAYILRC